jgi:hypothetical protein
MAPGRSAKSAADPWNDKSSPSHAAYSSNNVRVRAMRPAVAGVLAWIGQAVSWCASAGVLRKCRRFPWPISGFDTGLTPTIANLLART